MIQAVAPQELYDGWVSVVPRTALPTSFSASIKFKICKKQNKKVVLFFRAWDDKLTSSKG